MIKKAYIKLFENWLNEAEGGEEKVQGLIKKISSLVRASAKDRARLEFEFRKKLSLIKNPAEKESMKRQLAQELELVSKPWRDSIIKDQTVSQAEAEKISQWAESIEDALYAKEMMMMKTQFERADLDTKGWEDLYNQIEAQKAIVSHNLLISKELGIESPTAITQ